MFGKNESLRNSGSPLSSAQRAQASKESYVKLGAATLALLLLVAPTVSGVRISEVMYDLQGTDKGLEWIEVHNHDNTSVNMTGWKLYEQETKHKLKLVQGDITLQPNGYAIIVDKPTTWLEAHSEYTGTVIDSAFSLKNTGEYIALMNMTFDIQHNVSYTSELGAKGNGLSLLLNTTSGLLYEGTIEGGTPGEGTKTLGMPATPKNGTEHRDMQITASSPIPLYYSDDSNGPQLVPCISRVVWDQDNQICDGRYPADECWEGDHVISSLTFSKGEGQITRSLSDGSMYDNRYNGTITADPNNGTLQICIENYPAMPTNASEP